MKNDVVELDGLQAMHLTGVRGGNRLIEPLAALSWQRTMALKTRLAV
jgi:hypothetical protein